MIDAKGCSTLATLLRDQSLQLLERWSQRVLEDPSVPAADRLSKPSLVDRVAGPRSRPLRVRIHTRAGSA
jgi:hypothetical protein